MIRIHRSRPMAYVGRKRVHLSYTEHSLLITLGMMDNKIISADLLIETSLENAVKTPDDQQVLWQRIARLRRKIGNNRIQVKRNLGYILVGETHFVE